jgi:CheY-like chemotaxis protein
VRLMGGELTLADNPGGGSIFAFAVSMPECAVLEPASAVETRAQILAGSRALIIAHSPFEAPAIGARLTEAGVSVKRADGLGSGLKALSGAPAPDLVIVDCALGPEATNRLAQAARTAGVKRSLLLFSPFERRAFGETALKGFDGWLVKPVRARSLFERAAWDPPPAAAAALRRSPGSAPARRALIAEDNDINALIAQKALRRMGFEVARAMDGEEALRLASPTSPLESRPFDVILMDLKMPGLDGYEATRRLRRLEAAYGWSPTPVVALTANALEESRRSCMAAGFDAFLVKPVDFRALAATLQRVCAAGAAPWRERLRAS